MQSPRAPQLKDSPLPSWPVALALCAGGVVLFGLFFQHVFYGDAPLQLVSYRAHQPTGHRLHYWLTTGLGALGLSPLTAIQAASFVPAGLALGVLYTALVRAGARRSGALVGTLLLAMTPSALFFATTVEVHGLQLLGASVGLLCAVHMARPSSPSLAALWAWSLLAIVALGATHPMNLQAGGGLAVLFLVGLRARGASTRAMLLVAALAALGVAAVAVLVSYGYLDRQGWSVGVLLDSFKWRWSAPAPGSELPAPLANGLHAVIEPAAWLLLVGALGLLSLGRKKRGLGLGLLAWVLVPALVLMGPDFTERGAYFIVALPALALGAGHLASQSRVLGAICLVALLGQAQLAIQGIRAWDQPAPEEAQAWLDGLSRVSAGRGILLSEDAQQQDWARRYLGMPTDNLRLFLALPEPELVAFAETFTAYAKKRASEGEPLFLPAAIIELAPEIPPLATAVDILRREIEFQPVEAPGFRGYKGR